MFWLHHSYVEKVFTDWQASHGSQGIPSGPSGLDDNKQAPFNDHRYNKFMQVTDLTNREAWDYENRLCYKYEGASVALVPSQPGPSQENPKINVKIGFIIPETVKGYSFTFSACSYDNDCEMGTAYQFGATDHIDGNTLPIKPKLFKIELKDVTGLKMKFVELQGK